MAGLFNRLKKWTGLDVIQATDLNGEFDNIINNLGPSGMSGWSQSVAQMQIQTSPGTFGSESLATSLNGEIERIRYQLNAIIGGSDGVWYDTPQLSISQMNSLLSINPPPNRISSGAVSSTSLMPMHLIPNGSTASVTLKCSVTPFQCVINGTTYTFSTDIVLGSLGVAPSTGNQFTISDANCDLTAKTAGFGGVILDNSSNMNDGTFRLLNDYPINGNAVGASVSSLAGTFQAFSYSHGGNTEYFTAFVNEGASSTTIGLSKVQRGFFFNSSLAGIPAIPLNNGDPVTLMQLVWLYVNTSGALLAVYTHPRYSSVQPTTSAAGDYWYDMVNQKWKVSNGSTYSVANATPVGVCVTNSTACVAARSFDWYRAYSNASNVHPEWLTTSEYRTKFDTNSINVYGNTLSFDKDTVRWTSTNLESGTTLTGPNTYYLYLSEIGTPYISKYLPLRRYDLGGFYHPYNSWRCCGLFLYNSGGAFDNIAYSKFGNLNGQFLNDKSVGVDKLTSSPYVIYDVNATTPLVASVGQISMSTIANTSGISPGVNTPTIIQDGNAKAITASLWCSGRPIEIEFIQDPLSPGTACIIQDNQGTSTTAAANVEISLYQDGSIICNFVHSAGINVAGQHSLQLTPSAIRHKQFNVTPGVHTYTSKFAYLSTTDQITIFGIRLMAREI